MFLKPTQSHAQSFVFSKRNLNILLLLLHRFQKVPFSSVYTRPESPKTISFSNFSTLESVLKFFLSHRKRCHRFHRFRLNRRPKRKNIFADSLTPVSCKRGLTFKKQDKSHSEMQRVERKVDCFFKQLQLKGRHNVSVRHCEFSKVIYDPALSFTYIVIQRHDKCATEAIYASFMLLNPF